MSGGSLDYFYHDFDEKVLENNRVKEYIDDVEIYDLLKDIYTLLYNLEWVMSGDTSHEEFSEYIKTFKKKWFLDSRDERIINYVNEKLKETELFCLKLVGQEERKDD